MTTNCFDVVSLFDLKKTASKSNSNKCKDEPVERPSCGCIYECGCVSVRQVENGFVTAKDLKACSFVWLAKIYENEAKMYDKMLDEQGGKRVK